MPITEDQFCPKCGSEWAVHAGDGACPEDDALRNPPPYPKTLNGNDISLSYSIGTHPSGHGLSYFSVHDKQGRFYMIRVDEVLQLFRGVEFIVSKKRVHHHLNIMPDPVPDSAFGFDPGPTKLEREKQELWMLADTVGHDAARNRAVEFGWMMAWCADCKEIAPFIEASTECLFCGRQIAGGPLELKEEKK